MSVMQQYVMPIIIVIFIILFTGFCAFGLYKFIRSFLPKELNAWMKFKILRKPYPEEDVAWCVNAYESCATPIEVEKHLKINGVPDNRVEETVYIFKEIIKMKGGLKIDDRQIKTSSLKTFQRGSGEEKSEEKN